MRKPIVGVTVGTTTSPRKIENEIKPVKTVNGVSPDENGNVEVKGGNGVIGENGATFTPSVSADGVLSWTNDKGLDNPEAVSIKGKDGRDGIDGKDGYTPQKNVDYFDGKDGLDGKNGVDGKDGQDGYTPQKGVDYWTEADKAEIVQAVMDGIGVPVYGFVDENNHVTLKGDLPENAYTFGFEMADGSEIYVGALKFAYVVTNALTNCTNSNKSTSVSVGGSYSATITANSGYELKSLAVTMGGQSVSVSGGNISIAKVTGDIVITAVAEVSKPTNLLPNATFTDSELSSFTTEQKQESANGYVSGYRLSASKGSLSTSSGNHTSGFIPVGVNDTVTIENIALEQSSGNINNIVFYNSAKEFVYGLGGPAGGKVFGNGVTNNNGVYTFTPTSCGAGAKAVSYFRVSCASITTNSIITVTKA